MQRSTAYRCALLQRSEGSGSTPSTGGQRTEVGAGWCLTEITRRPKSPICSRWSKLLVCDGWKEASSPDIQHAYLGVVRMYIWWWMIPVCGMFKWPASTEQGARLLRLQRTTSLGLQGHHTLPSICHNFGFPIADRSNQLHPFFGYVSLRSKTQKTWLPKVCCPSGDMKDQVSAPMSSTKQQLEIGTPSPYFCCAQQRHLSVTKRESHMPRRMETFSSIFL